MCAENGVCLLYGSEVRVCACVIETSFPSIKPLALTSSLKFALVTGWRV